MFQSSSLSVDERSLAMKLRFRRQYSWGLGTPKTIKVRELVGCTQARRWQISPNLQIRGDCRIVKYTIYPQRRLWLPTREREALSG